MKHLFLALLLVLPVSAFGQHSHAPAKEPAPVALAEGLGSINLPVTTTNPEAQKFFNQGLAYIYAFNHEEAVRSFKQATQLDPQLAMGYWGMALALGSNYNVQADGPSLLSAYTNLQKAVELAPKASEHERGYISALAKRYSSDLNVDKQKLAIDYKNAMGELAKRYPDDPDAATLYAESMMNLRPWKLWSLDGKPAEDTLEIVSVLESVLRRYPNHTGANHYYIHAVEASNNAERALPSAARLGKVAPKAGHLVHMPSHIYIRTGDYTKAAQSNVDAIAADREYITKTGNQGLYTMMYYNHNIHFLASASALKGRYADSIKSARELEANVAPHLKAMPMLEMFRPYPIISQVRFGRWDDVLKEPKPDDALKITTGFWHYARGSAYAAMNQPDKADAELKVLQALVKTIPADAPMGNNVAVNVMKIADLALAGRIAFARGDKQAAFNFLNQAAAAEDGTSYNEPADWDLPVREVLGGMLLNSGDYAAAEKAFRDELKRHPRNGRALFGLAESLKGQGNKSGAQMVWREFEEAWKDADTKLTVAALSGIQTKAENGAPASTAAPVQFASVLLKTGVRLRYAYQGDPNGIPVILLHGYTDSWFSFSQVLPLLDQKYRVYTLDQRGHGESDRPVGGYAMQQFAGDVVAFMDAMNIKQATIVGHSMGSFVAQHVAVEAPERVKRLVLVATATTIHTNDLARQLQREVNALTDPVPQKFVHDFQVSTAFQPLSNEFFHTVLKESMRLPAHVWREVMAEMMSPDAAVELKKIKTPTLVLWGDKDFFPRSEQDSLVSAMPNAVLKVYKDTGHALHWERPETFATDLKTFINSDLQAFAK
ncbi:MAG TPA: alpha/beta fold hydrolase [Pyrinomonadaceae bacterium]|nr:alpha/beta fold hydrolase [Pyrinomonadaceae bacterium]